MYVMAAPGGIFQKHMVSLFEGRYAGLYKHHRFGDVALYNIPVMFGMSGAAILNKKGAVVGVLSAGNMRFHHIMLGTRYNSTVQFIIHNVKRDLRKRNGDKLPNKLDNIKFK